MIVRGRWHDSAYTLSLKPDSLSVAINVDTVIVCDRAGRFYSLYQDSAPRSDPPGSRHFRRSLSGQMLQKWSGAGGRQRQQLEHTHADAVIDFAADQLRQLCAALTSPDWQWLSPPDHPAQLDELLRVIERGARFDSAAARLDAARFAEVYAPIGMLPPDQYLALVLQATEGCSFNTCTFCDLYHHAFRVKTPDEFRQHIRNVRDYLGESILLRRKSIFLGAANALAIPMARLVPLLEIVREEFSPSLEKQGRARANAGIGAFLDAFTGTRKSAEDYRVLANLGLRRVYIGLESGHDPLLHFVKKPGCAADAVETVNAIKAAGVNVGVIVMIGLGGDQFAGGHIRDTIDVLNHMQLGQGDLIYFSDLVEEPGTSYPLKAAQRAIRPLDADERAAQRAAIRRGLKLDGPKISNYDVREFVY